MENTKGYSVWMNEIEIHVMNVNFRRFNQAVPAHTHGENAYEFHYVAEGEGTVVMQGTSYGIKPGMLYVTGPGIVHEQIPNKDGFLMEFGVYLQLPSEVLPTGTVIHSLGVTPCWIGQATSELSSIVTTILWEMKEKRLGFEEKMKHLLAEFLIACARNYASIPVRNNWEESQERKRKWTNGEVCSQLMLDEIFLYEYRDITLDILAGRMGLSVRQAQRRIKRVYGKSFQEKKLEARMSAAAMMLVNGDRKITDISERLGYSSIEHFSGAFTRYYGLSPRKYRKQNRNV